MARAAPLWLARPSRLAGLSPVAARRMLALVAVLLLAALLALGAQSSPAGHDPAVRFQDRVMFDETIADGVRHGGDYYTVAADALRGSDPSNPSLALRLPTLAVAEGAVPRFVAVIALYVLAAAVLIAWRRRLTPAFAGPAARWIAMLLLTGGMAVFVRPDLVALHEVWAALLIALSLALRRSGRWIEAGALGLAAMLIAETAALYVLVMAVVALVEGERREASGWAVTLGVFAVALVLHAHAVAAMGRPLGMAPGWMSLPGLTHGLGIAMGIGPAWIAAPLVMLASIGWAAWRDPLATRALATSIVYLSVPSVIGETDPLSSWLLIAPILPVGLAFVPDALRDLIAPALDTRRITVKRVVR